MAKKSETITTRWIEGAERVCRICGRPIKNLERDVGEVRTVLPGYIREIKCMDCHVPRRRKKEAE